MEERVTDAGDVLEVGSAGKRRSRSLTFVPDDRWWAGRGPGLQEQNRADLKDADYTEGFLTAFEMTGARRWQEKGTG
jgi:hypothetical protein